MIKKLRIRFMLIFMILMAFLLAIPFICVPYVHKSNTSSRVENTLSVILNRPDAFAEDSKNTSDIYGSFYVDRLGNISKKYGTVYNISELSIILKAIYKDQNNDAKFYLPMYELYYSFRKDISTNGTWYVLMDAHSENMQYQNLVSMCRFLYVISIIFTIPISYILALFGTRPIEKAWQEQKRFVADASHELKTPLTVIITNAELLKKDASKNQQDRYIQNIFAESIQMKTLVQNLLDLARTDRGFIKKDFAKFDFTKLINETSLVMEVELFERGHELITTVDDNINIKGDYVKISQLIYIILDNAGKYSDEKTPIHMSLTKDGRNHAILDITNSGNEISKDEQKKIFNRFYRTDKARSLNGSYGLGLSIAYEIANAHKAKIWVESKNHKVSFKVRFKKIK